MAKDQYFITYKALTPPPMVSEEESRTSKLPTFLQPSWNNLSHIEDNAIDFKINEDESVPYDYLPDELTSNQIPTNSILSSVVNYAESLVGIPYKFGGLSSQTGTDCSGLVYLSYKQAGINVPRTVKELEKFGQEIKNINDIQPGDLLCYNSSKSPSGKHVTMVSNIDNNGGIWVVNAKGKKYGVIKERADLSNIKTIRRPLSTQNTTAFSDDNDYVRTMRPYLAKALTDNGIDASLWTDTLVAHTSIESNWGRSQLATLNNNFGGIKGSGSSFKTKERTSNGKYVTINSSFKKYNSIQEFADDYVKLLKNKFHAFDGTPKDFARNLKENKYYTDSLLVYSNNINSRLNKISTV